MTKSEIVKSYDHIKYQIREYQYRVGYLKKKIDRMDVDDKRLPETIKQFEELDAKLKVLVDERHACRLKFYRRARGLPDVG